MTPFLPCHRSIVGMLLALLLCLLQWDLGMAELESFDQVVRYYYPAGFTENHTSGPPDLYGYGFGSLEQSFYDASQKIFYGGSELGFITVSNFGAYVASSVVTDYGIPLNYSLTDLEVCNGLLFVSTKDDPNPGYVHVYEAVKRAEDGTTLSPPTFLQSIEVGVGPDKLLVSKDCMMLVTANEGEADYDDETGLVNPAGSVSIVRGPFNDTSTPPTVSQVSLNHWTDNELIAMGVHLSLSKNAMMYWSQVLSLNFTDAIANYQTEQSLEPEYLAWNDDETIIYCNLQENNALVVIDVATNNATAIHPYGLKSNFPVDVVEDDGCAAMPVVEGLSFLRSVDAIASVTQNGKQYILTANEGDDVEYGDYAERTKAGDIFAGATLAFPNMTADATVFSTSSLVEGYSKYFNAECDTANGETEWCSPDMRLTLGTAMINYSNPETPVIQSLVGIGGRGISIYEVTPEEGLVLVFDSGDALEREGCAAYPWAHNAIQDEEFAPVGGTFFNSLDADDDLRTTIEEMNDPDADGCTDGGNGRSGACPMGETVDERSLKDGPAAETIVTGEACGGVYAVTVSEKNSVGYLYDITDVTNPELVKVFHLSLASESMNPGLAYDERNLGEIDSESIQFLSPEESPTGKAAVLFAGAFSGTASFWEFTCVGSPTEKPGGDEPTAAPKSDARVISFLGALVVGMGTMVLQLLL